MSGDERACAQDDHDRVWQAGREAGYRDALIALAEHRGEFFDELGRHIADSMHRDREFADAHVAAARAEEREAALAEVRALADEWDAPEMHPVGFNMTCWDAARRLRALLPVTESRDGDGR